MRHLTSMIAFTALSAPAWFAACSDDDDTPHGHEHEEGGTTGGSSSTGGKGSGGRASGGTSGAGGGPGTGGSKSTGGTASGGDDGGAVPEGGDAGPVAVTLNFKAKVGTRDFACNQTYEGFGSAGVAVKPVDFRLFVQDIALIDAGGNKVPVTLDVAPPWQNAKVAFLDFENAAGDCAGGFSTTAATNTVVKGTVPAGTYTGVSFSNGVPEEWNHADPATLPEPLQAGAAMSWGWLLGYRFSVIEFNALAGGDGGTNQAWIHLGSTGCTNTPLPDGGTDYTKPPTTTCAKPNRNEITLSGFTLGSSIIVIDAARLFAGVDVATDGQSGCHGMGPACPAGFAAMGLDYATGTKTSTQMVYRLE